MYEVLQLSWEEVRDKNIVLKSSTSHMTIDVKGSEIQSSLGEDSDIIIFYSMIDKMPFMLLESINGRVSEEKLAAIRVPGFRVTKTVTDDVTEVVLVKEELYAKLAEQEATSA